MLSGTKIAGQLRKKIALVTPHEFLQKKSRKFEIPAVSVKRFCKAVLVCHYHALKKKYRLALDSFIVFSQLELAKRRWDIAQFVYLYTGQRSSERQQVRLQHWQSVLLTAKYFRRYFVFRYKMHIILILSLKNYPIFEHLTSFMEQLLMYFRRHKRMETNMVKGHFTTKSLWPLDVSAPRRFGPRLFCVHHIQKLVRVLQWLKH